MALNDTQLGDFEEVKFSHVNPEQVHKISMETSHYEYSNFFQPAQALYESKAEEKDDEVNPFFVENEEEKSFSVDSGENSECDNQVLNDLDSSSNEFEMAQESDDSL